MEKNLVSAQTGQAKNVIGEEVFQDGSRMRMTLTGLKPPAVKIEFIKPDGTIVHTLDAVYVGKDGEK